MITLKKKQYDYIISLGGCCDVANQLKHRGLRPCAFPLDWTLMVDEKPLRYLPEGIRTRFKCLCVRKNMVEFQLPSREYGVERHKFEDRATGFRFIHHFSCPVEDVDAFEKTRQILQRRIERFFDTVSGSKNVLFVLSTVFPYEDELVKDIYMALAETFSETKIALVAIQFSAAECKSYTMLDGSVCIKKCERPRDDRYDTQFTAPEWKWMDDLSLADRLSPANIRRKTIVKLKYKLWKWLGKSLERAGAGCVCMRFR